MTNNVTKTIPIDLNSESRYSVRLRSFNSFGVGSAWSESLVIDTSAAGLETARRLMITGDGMVAYDGYGRMVFNFSSTAVVRTNLVTNPSIEVNTTGWDALTNTSISRVTDDFFVGEPSAGACLKVQATAAASSIGFVTSSTRRISGTSNLPYTVTAYVKVPVGQPAVKLKVGFRFYGATNTLISEVVSFVVNEITSSNNWVRISNVAITAPSGTSTIGVVIYSSEELANGQYYLVDGIMVEQSSVLRDYFDGSTSKDQTTWSGVAHDSSSVLDTNTTYSVNGGVFTEATIQTSAEPYTGVKITADGIRGYAPGATPTETFFLDAATGSLTIAGAAPPGGDSVPVGGAAADVNSNSTTISGNKIRSGSITSNGYSGVTDGSAFSTTGTNFNLIDGTITAKNWRINASGDVFFVGAITGGTIDIGSAPSTSFHVDSTANMWLGASSFASAPFKVSNAGDLTCNNATITGSVITNSSVTTAPPGSNQVTASGGDLVITQVSDGAAKLQFAQSSTSWLSRIESNAGLWIRSKTATTSLASDILLGSSAGSPRFEVSLSNGSSTTTAFHITGVGSGASSNLNAPFSVSYGMTVGTSLVVGTTVEIQGTGAYFTGASIVGTNNAMGLRWDAGFASIMGTVDNSQYATLGTVSDRRLKHDIKQLDSVKKQILKLNPITFNGKDFDGSIPRPEHRMAGLIADEVQEVFPGLVVGEATDSTYQSVSYSLMAPYLVKAVQELFEENDKLRKRILKLEKTE